MTAVPSVPEPTKVLRLPAYELYEARNICNQTLRGFTETIYPETTLTLDPSGAAQFRIPGTTDWIDPNKSYIYMSGKFVGQVPKKGDTALVDISDPNAEDFSWVNMLPQAYFKSVDVTVGNVSVTQNDSNYMYRAYLQTLLNTTAPALNTYMSTAGWVKDDGDWDGVDAKKNTALATRRKMINAKKECYFTFDIATPFFQISKFLISDCDVTLKLQKNPNPAFYMMHSSSGSVDFQVTQICLKLRKVTPNSDTLLELENKIASSPLTYVLDDPRFIINSVQAGETYIHREYVTSGHHPKRAIVVMLETEAYNGHAERNPFRFQHFNVGRVSLTKNGLEYPTPAITCDFANKNYVEAYRHLLASLQADKSAFVPDITLKDFENGAFILSWDMSPDQYGCDDPQMIVNRSSNIKLSIEFKTPLAKAVTLIFYYQLESRVTLNQSLQVTIEAVG